MAHVTVQQALQYVADHPVPAHDNLLELPVWELVSRELFEIANRPDVKVRGSMVRATKAQRVIFDRLVGVRKPGTKPVSSKAEEIEFVDLTQGVISV